MRALQIAEYQAAVQLTEIAKPTITADQLLIEVVAASVNPVDYKIQQGAGKYVLGNRLPLTLGHDFSGIVREVGSAVKQYQVGDRVFGRVPKTGAFCDYVAVGVNDIAQAPTSVSLIEAAAVPLVGLTAIQGLTEGLQVQDGQTILITGGAGGVGSAAIAIAHALGVKVVTTASPAGAAFLADYQPETIMNYQTTSLKDSMIHVDSVFDTRGGQDLVDSFSVVKTGGKVATIVSLPTADFGQKLGFGFWQQQILRMLTHRYTKLARAKAASFYAFFTQSNSEQLAFIATLIDTGAYPIRIEQQFPLAQGQQAIDLVKQGHVKGKVVLVLNVEDQLF